MKNILFLHSGAELYGADFVLLSLLSNIDRNRFTPLVCLPNEGPLMSRIQALGIETYIVDYPILRRQYFSLSGIFNYIKTYKKSCKKIISILGNRNIDIVHVNTVAVLEGIYISRYFKKPLIWHIHEIINKPRVVYLATSAFVGIFASKIVAVSEAVKKHLINSGLVKEEKITVIYNGIDTDKFKPDNDTSNLRKELNIPRGSFVLGMIGRVNAIKGQDEFIKISTQLIHKYNNVYGLIVGNAFAGQEWRIENLKETIAKERLGNNLQYLGFRNDVEKLHCLFDVYILPSIQPDSLPTVVLESMASKKVVVGYSSGGINEMVINNETGFIEDIYDSESLIEDIEKLINNDVLYARMANAGYERLKSNFTIKLFIKQIENVYKNTN